MKARANPSRVLFKPTTPLIDRENLVQMINEQ